MVYLNIRRNTYIDSLLWFLFIVLTTEGCLGYTVYCEVGAGVCLDFFKNNSFGTYAIRVRDLPFCLSFDGQSTYIFSNNFGNESSFNCSVSKTIMSVCIGNFQSKDAGIYSLHDGLTPSSNILKSIRVVKASQQFNMTGSLEFASLRQAYTWTCSMFVPPEQTVNAVKFYRNNILCGLIGYLNNDCVNQSANPRYTYACLSDYVYTLTIPAENMTEYEQGSLWRCEYVVNSSYRSSDVIIKIARPPTVHMLSQEDILEGRDLSVTCKATPGNPSSTTFYWTKVDNPGFRKNGSTLHLPNIQRISSGTYRCTAENNYNKEEKGTDSQSMDVNVLYPPTIKTLSQQDIVEGKALLVTCQAVSGNPNSTTFYWTKEDNPGFRQNGSTLHIPNIQRASSGTYRCTAENNYSIGEKGTHSQPMIVNVLYQPTIERRSLQVVNESEKFTITRYIVSNPLSDASWYNGTQLLKTQTTVKTASYTIENTTCTDTKNYTLVTSNGIGNTVTARVELIVNCKPTPDITNITLAVSCTTGIKFSTIIIAYPEPQYELQYENGTRNDQMITTITENKVNNFTVRIRQHAVEKSSFGVYYLRASNMFGEKTVTVNVIKQRKPDLPRNIKVTCKVTEAIVQWISSFNGGDIQNFTVITLSGHDGTNLYNGLNDKGENEIHVTYVSSLQPSVTYWFSVSAKNSHGSSFSKAISCTTAKETASSLTAVVTGSVGGSLVLVTIILIVVFFVHRRYTCIFKLALEKRNIDIKVDPNKKTSNYTTIKEQQEHTERNMYDELAPNENASQYEDILKKDNHGKNEKLYEKLQKSVDNDGEGKAMEKMIPLKSKESSDDKSVTQKAEEYANTSFMK
ncbi:synaptogenesis protein syg-2-like [Crassostrea angulata]|uniref:synaptogenesis protein syg-2-like n=1 Tax=Magallana angulata TaxID=2784310 RepID=UPI0022B18651|nr:synaptogenesis protein syg-2-like [Crassostrea angulata]